MLLPNTEYLRTPPITYHNILIILHEKELLEDSLQPNLMQNIAVNTQIQIQDIQTLLQGMLCHLNLHMLRF